MGQRIRGRRLQAIRSRLLRANPLCVMCSARGIYRAATQVDHVVALANGGADDDSNRQGLCDDCHAVKTAHDLGYSVKGCAVDGSPIDAAHPWNATGGRAKP